MGLFLSLQQPGKTAEVFERRAPFARVHYEHTAHGR
jgi:hypothetical protein